MKAAIVDEAGRLQNVERPIPSVGDGDVLIRVHACGVCGTDVHIVHGGFPHASGIALGHEFSGEVVEIGRSVSGVSVGDRVTVDPNVPDWSCWFCRRGEINHCRNRYALGVDVDGGFAEYCVAPAGQAHKVPENVSLDEAALVEPLACCVRGIDRADIRSGDTVAILGAGAIGLMLMQLARAVGATRIVVSEPDERKRDLAAKFGADLMLDPLRDDVRSEIMEYTEVGPDIVIESAGRVETAELAISVARPGGKVLQFGVVPPDRLAQIAPNEVFRKELTILGSLINPFTHSRAIDLLAAGRVEVAPLISHRFPLQSACEALIAAQGRDVVKALIVPGSSA